MANTTHTLVHLSLDNLIIPDDQLHNTPSKRDGVDGEAETDLRILGCELVQLAGKLLKLPQVAMATAQTLFQRFFYRKSFVGNDFTHVAMACIFLAAKIEEAPRRSSQVMNVFHHIVQRRAGKAEVPLNPERASYTDLKNFVIKAERRVLKELGFNVHIQHPHKLIINYLALLELESSELSQRAWNYMNDSFRTNVFCRFHPPTIASATIWLAARDCKIKLTENWWEVFDATLVDVREVAATIVSLYSRARRSKDELDALVADCLQQKQQRLKEAVAKSLPVPSVLLAVSPVTPTRPNEDKRDNESERKNGDKDKTVEQGRSNERLSRHSSSVVSPRSEKGRDREREREKGRSRFRSRSRSRSRDVGPSRERERDRKEYRDRDTHREKERERDRERDHFRRERRY